MGWATGWTYRKSHTINPASGAGQNYQKRIVVHYGAGVDGDEDVYLDGKCLTNFGDIRFTDKTGVALLDYWIETKADSNCAVCWVEISDDLSVYDGKLYIYYGKAGAASVANGDNTFIFFDDFEVDLSKWQFVTQASISPDRAYTGSKCLKLEVIGGNGGQVGKLLSQANVAIHVHYYDIMSAEAECHLLMVSDSATHDSAIGVMSDISNYEYMPDAFLPTPIDTGINRTVGWHEFIITCHANDLAQPWLGGLRQFFVDGILMPNTAPWYANIFLLLSSIGFGHDATGKSYWDSVFYTKYIDPEPAHGVWGAEESDGMGATTFTAEDVENTILGKALELDDVVYSLSRKILDTEEIGQSLLGSLHLPILSEDLLVALLGSTHIPILSSEDMIVSLLAKRLLLSEDVIVSLLAKRTLLGQDVIYERPLLFRQRMMAFPVIGGSHIIQVKGEEE